ncbi:MAG TPA: hypothetical protein VMP68_03880 [Candidatus Eisenbacteria bacterium]|nr:hypothetical protein [Candidatus Eisenbacteria bacterium]
MEKQFSRKMDGRVKAIAALKFQADVGFARSHAFPTAIKMLEALTPKHGFGSMAENQIGLG